MNERGYGVVPSETLASRDAGSEPPWTGSRRVSEGTTPCRRGSKPPNPETGSTTTKPITPHIHVLYRDEPHILCIKKPGNLPGFQFTPKLDY